MVAVNGNQVLWLDHSDHQLQIFLASVAGGVHRSRSVVDNLGPLSGEVVFQALDAFFVAGDNGRRKNDGVIFGYLNMFMPLVGYSHQRSVLFALRAGANGDDFRRMIVVYFFNRNYHVFFGMKIAQSLYYFKAGFKAVAVYNHFFVAFFGNLYYFNHSFYVRRKHPDYDSVFRFRHHFFQILVDDFFRNGKARFLGVGAFQKQNQIIFFAQFLVVLNIYGLAVFVQFYSKVSRINDVAVGGIYDNADSVRYGVSDIKEFYFQFSKIYNAVGSDFFYFQRRHMPEFILSVLNNRFGESGGVDDGESQFVYEVGNRSHVIHMPVANYKSFDSAFVFFQIFGVGDNEVYTRGFLFRKLDSGIYDYDFIAIFNDRHIAAYFFHSADGDYPDRHLLFFCLFFHK